MPIIAIIPTQKELDLFLRACAEAGLPSQPAIAGRLNTTHFAGAHLTVALGGLGKVQFAVHTQHLVDQASWDLVVCAGAAGALVESVSVGDVVIASETVEHDIRNQFGKPLLPRFPGSPQFLAQCSELLTPHADFRIHYGPVASGDEDVVHHTRREAIQARTGALAVAWEGAGGARACHFSGTPYLEIRAVSDSANDAAAQDYASNLPLAMRHAARVVVDIAQLHKGRAD